MCLTAYFRPETLSEALNVLQRESVTVAAGCTDLFPMTERPRLQGDVLDITAIPDLRGIRSNQTSWRIGATTTWTDIVRADLPPAFDMLKQAASEVGSVQIQNAGTVAGNLCNASPAADGVPALLALDASVELTSSQGVRQLPLDQFLTGVRKTQCAGDEILTAVDVPARSGEGVSRFLKLGARRYLVISIAMVAARLSVNSGRITSAAIAVGACSPVAQRLSDLEATLVGLPLSDAGAAVTHRHVTPALSPIDDVRGGADYRQDAAVELVQRAINDIAGELA